PLGGTVSMTRPLPPSTFFVASPSLRRGRATLFPYTTLFRSLLGDATHARKALVLLLLAVDEEVIGPVAHPHESRPNHLLIDPEEDRKSTRLTPVTISSRMPSPASKNKTPSSRSTFPDTRLHS